MAETEFQITNFRELISNFYRVKKRILQKRPVSSRESKVKEYIESLITTYNSILIYTKPHINNISIESRQEIFGKIIHCRELLFKCFCKLNCRVRVPYGVDLFEEIKRSVLTVSESEEEVGVDDSEYETDIGQEIEIKLGCTTAIYEDNKIDLCDVDTEKDNYSTMASIEEKTKYITMCSSIIRDNYGGDPLGLSSFLDKINLIEEITAPNLAGCFIAFLKSKLDGRAREVLPETIDNVEQIKNALSSRIKPDSSKVVAGRMAGLHIKDNNYENFAKNVEDLADSLQRSLIIEGVTKGKALEMAMESTVSVCRNNAKSDMVKAILASSTFTEPKDVLAKLITEESNTQGQHQVLAMRQTSNRPPIGQRDNEFRYPCGNYNGSYRGRSNNNNNYRRRSNYGRYRRQNNANNRGSVQGRHDGQHVRGNFRRQNYSVRTLNSESPQQVMLGEEEQQ